MDCRTFQNKHLAFLDDTLPDFEMVALRRHIVECRECAQRDSTIRRALLVYRNVPRIEPSPEFHTRLRGRLRECRLNPQTQQLLRGPGLGTLAAAAACMLVVGALALAGAEARPMIHPPVLASAPIPEPSPLTDPVVVASASAGIMPVWPALYIAEEGPMHLAAARWTR